MNNDYKHPKAPLIGIIALIIMPLMGACIDVYTPSLPAIQTFFNCTVRLTQFTITFYIISYGISQLLFGTLSDILGRKRLLIFGCILFTLASLLAPLSSSILLLIFFRTLQGLAAGAIGSTCRALIPDAFSGKSYHKMINYLTLAWGCGPILAPVIGGYLQHYFNWHAPLLFLAGYGLLALILACIVPETLPPQQRSTLHHISGHYKIILTSSEFIAYVTLIMMIYGTMTMFNVIGPFLIQVILHQNAIVYGHLSLLFGVAWLSGNLLNRFTIQYDVNKKIYLSLGCNLIITGIMLYYFHLYSLSTINLTITIFLLNTISGLILPNGYSLSLALFPQAVGSASAIMGSLFITGSGLATIVAAFLKTTTAIPLLYAYLAMFVISLALIFVQARRKKISSQ